MPDQPNGERIVWAVDALGADDKIQEHTAKSLAKFTQGRECEIEPVCVLFPPNPYGGGVGIIRLFAEEEQKKIQTTINQWLKKIKLPGLLPARLLTINRYSTRKAVEALSTHAETWGAGLIVASTHARTGLSRAFLGSFAESLLSQSKVPVLVVNPSFRVKPKIKKILFPTDFSKESESAFERTLDLAALLKAKVILHHKHEQVPLYTVRPIFVAMELDRFAQDDLAEVQKRVLELETRARQRDISIQTIISRGRSDVHKSILKTATDMKVDLIAMGSQTRTTSASLLGSTARHVVRGAPCPVWVLHSS